MQRTHKSKMGVATRTALQLPWRPLRLLRTLRPWRETNTALPVEHDKYTRADYRKSRQAYFSQWTKKNAKNARKQKGLCYLDCPSIPFAAFANFAAFARNQHAVFMSNKASAPLLRAESHDHRISRKGRQNRKERKKTGMGIGFGVPLI